MSSKSNNTQQIANDSQKIQLLQTENEKLKSKIEELNEMVSLQNYYIDEYREKYEEAKEENDVLKEEIKRIHYMEQENIALHRTIDKKDEIINKQKKTIYNLQHPSKWQWCDFNGYVWKDFEDKLSKKIDKSYTNNLAIFRYELNKGELYEFKFNQKRQKIENEISESKLENESIDLSHKMIYFTKKSNQNIYFLKRVDIKYKSNYFLNAKMWTGPARNTFGTKIMTLYHVTDKYAADIIRKTRVMKCGKTGRFGAGIYFAEKITTAQKRAHHKGYVVTAKVLVGNEYIVKENDSGQFDATINFEKLTNKDCDSVYAMEWTERVVYNSDQILVTDVKRMSSFQFIFKS